MLHRPVSEEAVKETTQLLPSPQRLEEDDGAVPRKTLSSGTAPVSLGDVEIENSRREMLGSLLALGTCSRTSAPSGGLGCTRVSARAADEHAQLARNHCADAGLRMDCQQHAKACLEGEGVCSEADWPQLEWLLLKAVVDLPGDASKESVLQQAVARGCVDVVQAVLDAARRGDHAEHRKMVDSANADGLSPLLVAVLAGRLEVVLALLGADASVTALTPDGRSVLHCAVQSGQTRITQALFQHAPKKMALFVTQRCADKLQGTPLHLAVNCGDANGAKYLIEKCPESINTVAYIPDRDNGNVVIYCNLLHLVSVSGNAEVIEYFSTALRSSKDLRGLVHKTTSTGRTPLHFALLRKQHAFITALIAAGADLAAACVDKDNHTRTAIDMFIHQVPSSVEILGTILDNCITNTRYTFSIVLDFRVFLSTSSEKECSLRVLNALRKTGDKLGQNKLLEHPLVESYLFLLWKRLQGPYWVLVALNGLLASSLSLLVLFDLMFHDPLIKYALLPVGGVCMLPLLLHEVDCFYCREQPWKYRAESVMKIVCFVLIFCVGFLDSAECAAFAILLSWFTLILVISRIPETGFFMLMFIEVAAKYIKLLATFFFLIFGFVVAFLAIFRQRAPFQSFLSALMKTTVMMTNEFEYENFKLHEETELSLAAQVSAMIVLFLFIVLIGLVLTNLFVAVAVIDVRKLQIIRKRIEFLDVYETFLLSQSSSWPSFGIMRGLFRVYCVLVKRFRPRLVESWEFYRQLKPDYKFRIQANKATRIGFPERLNNTIISKGYENKERMKRLKESEESARKKKAEELAKQSRELERDQAMKELLGELVSVRKELKELRTKLLATSPATD